VTTDRPPAWRRYLRFWGYDAARDLDDELRFHVETLYDEYIAAGLDPVTARAEVDKRFGDLTRFRAQCAAIDSRWTRERDMTERLHLIAADLRYAARQIVRAPSLSIAAILCFALGIGANTSIFSVVDAVLFRPLPFADPDQLVVLGEELPRFGGGNTGTISPPEYADYKTLNGRVFHSSAIFENSSFVLTGSREPERVVGTNVSASLFDVLGVKAARGRTFLAGEDDLSAPDVAVLSDALWRRRFGADPTVVGRSATINGRQFQVVGIMPSDFAFPLPGLESGVAELFVPYKITPALEHVRGDSYSATFVARIAPGVTLAQAQRGASEVAKRLPQRYPAVYGPRHTTLAQLFSLRDRAVGNVKHSLLVLLAAVGLVLLIACINVSSLLLARAAARQRELSVRRALGASRGRLVQQFMTESFLLVTIGGGLGVAFSVWGAKALASAAPASLLQGYQISVDVRVLLFTAAISIGTAVLVSLAPALQQPEGALASALREEGRSASGGLARQRGRRTLVVTEIALALVVAIGAGLMVKSFLNARNADPGFNPEHLVSFRLALPDYRYRTSADIHQGEVAITDRLRNLPGVRSASAATAMPMAGTWHIAVSLEGIDLEKTPIVLNSLVFPDYFQTLQIPMRAGSAFTGRESNDAPRVAIINESFARKFFPGASPIGKRLKWGSPTSPAAWATIVGVSADVRQVSLDTPVEPAIYLPAFQQDTGLIVSVLRTMAYVVRTQGAPEQMLRAVRTAAHDADPELPIIDLRTMDDVVARSVSARRFNTALLGGFAVLALALAAVGIYGLMAYAVVQRTREIGIRIALGATPGEVLSLVVGQGARLAAVGVVIGLAGAIGLTRVMRTLLFDVSPLDPLAFAASALLLIGVAVLAAYLPARRAARIDPQRAIRAD
jgi:putative ABC transport system permease protein